MKKQAIVREVRAGCKYEHLYIQRDDETGEPILDAAGATIPIKFIYPVSVDRQIDLDLAETESKLGGKDKLKHSQKLARLLTNNPEGFEKFEEPFPTDDRPLADRALEYFSKPGMEGFAGDALLVRMNLIYPSPLFPGD